MAGKRKKLGVVGHPIEHSLSPVMHKAALQELGLDYEYGSYDMGKEALRDFIQGCRKDFLGLNVTIPHKVAVIDFLDDLSREAGLIGAVNTIKFSDGKAVGYNTDGIGCVKALKEAGISVKGRQFLVLGAGGAARAVVFQLLLEGAGVSVANRTRKSAVDLKKDVGERLGKDLHVIDFLVKEIGNELEKADVLINTTSAGMFPKVDEIIIHSDIIPRNVAVMDIVYNPIQTRLLREAWVKGCKTVNGVGMLVHQGAESLRIWLDIAAPVDVMEEAVLERLKKR